MMAQNGLCAIFMHSTITAYKIYQSHMHKTGGCLGLGPVTFSPLSSRAVYKTKYWPSSQVINTCSSKVLPGFQHSYVSASTSFFEGEYGSLRIHLPAVVKHNVKVMGPRAADDVPSYKGYPPMTNKPKWWWRTLACLPYLMPLHETWMYAETAYHLHPFLEDFEFCTYPFLAVIGRLPGWFLLAYFFGAYLGIVRNNQWPHFFRFHVVTGMLLEIILQVAGTINEWLPKGVYWGKIGMHYWLAIAFAFLFTVLECMRCALRGMYADVPFISDASYMQIPFD